MESLGGKSCPDPHIPVVQDDELISVERVLDTEGKVGGCTAACDGEFSSRCGVTDAHIIGEGKKSDYSPVICPTTGYAAILGTIPGITIFFPLKDLSISTPLKQG